jgi:hypothetical protein
LLIVLHAVTGCTLVGFVQISEADDQLRSPLHLALVLGIGLRVITEILGATTANSPAEITNNRKRLPIHLVNFVYRRVITKTAGEESEALARADS